MASTRQHEAPSSLSTRDQGLPSTPLAGPSAVRLSGFEDATSVFRTACAGTNTFISLASAFASLPKVF